MTKINDNTNEVIKGIETNASIFLRLMVDKIDSIFIRVIIPFYDRLVTDICETLVFL